MAPRTLSVVSRRPGWPSARPQRSTAIVAALVAVVVVSTACDDEPLAVQVVSLRTVPEQVRLNNVPVGLEGIGDFVVSNGGNAAWVPSGPPVVVGEGFAWVSGCDEPLGPGNACQGTLRFTPTAEGTFSGSLTVIAEGVGDVGQDVIVTTEIVATAVPPILLLSPDDVDYGTVRVGENRRETITATNVGDVDLDVSLFCENDVFTMAGQVRQRLLLPAGESQTINVDYSPRLGGPADGALRAELCGPGCGPAVSLRGIGSAPRIDADPRALDFATLAPGQRATLPLTIRNIGTGLLEVSALEVLSADPGLVVDGDLTFPILLLDDEEVQVSIAWQPTQGRAALDALVVLHSNDPVAPEAFVTVDGTADGPGLQVLPGALHYGRLLAGDSRQANLVVRSVGAVDVDITSIALEGQPFRFVTLPPTGPLAPGQALQFLVEATGNRDADADGGAVGALVVRATGGLEERAALTFQAGTSGCVPIARVGNVNLGFVQLNTGVSGDVVVENVGDAPCFLSSVDGGGLPFDGAFSATPVGLSTLNPGESGQVRFAFQPTRSGARSAIVGLNFADVAVPVFVSVTGTGVDGAVAFVPSGLSVGPVDRRCGDSRSTSVLANSSNRAVTITEIALTTSGAPFRISPQRTPPFALLPGATTPISVTFNVSSAPVGLSTAVVLATSEEGLDASLRLALDVTNAGSDIEERFTATGSRAVDILFVVDNSGSMFDDQALLAENFDAFFNAALNSGQLDFQVAITTTDVISADAAAGRFVGQPGVLRGGNGNLRTSFEERVLVGIDGTGLELGLEAMRLALTLPENSGFLRRDAALSVVFVTDEDDAGAELRFLPDPALSREPSEYIALLEGLKGAGGDAGGILVSGVLPAVGAVRYQELVTTFGGASLDIAQPDWGEQLSQIGIDTFSLARSYALEGVPQLGSIIVTVDGEATTDFVFDDARNAVVLDDTPRAGADVTVVYRSGC